MIDLELDERTINVDISNADQQILDVLTASTIDNLPGSEWRPTTRSTRRGIRMPLFTTC